MSILAERLRLAHKARCDGERMAIEDRNYAPGEAICGNCGWAFPPQHTSADDKLVFCSWWMSHKKCERFCRCWAHEEDCSAGTPVWCEAYTKRRLSI